jgi:hypothetical protein
MGRACIALAALALAISTGTVRAVEADPNMDYVISPEVGAWTICAASYSGEMSSKFAHDLVLELRSQYQLAAYVFNRGADLRRQQDEELQRKRQQQQEYLAQRGLRPDIPLRLPRVRIEDQYAVLVGGFKDIDAAHRELTRIKKLQPPKTVPRDVMTCDAILPPGDDKKVEGQRAFVNPFVTSFVVPNPSLPVPRQTANQPDPFWKKLNANETFSLLKCNQPWTLAVKEFPATAYIQPQSAPSGFLDKLMGHSTGEQLNANALNAHNLAEALRKVGFDAYVLHTRSNSIVTIGGFSGLDDPKMQQVQRAFAGNLQFGPNLDMFPKPMPMEVPRF